MTGQRGFTLLEALASLVITGLILIGLSQTLHILLGPVATRTDRMAEHTETALVLDHIAGLIADARPSGADQGLAVPFRGSADRIDFIAPGSNLTRGGGLARIALTSGAKGAEIRWAPPGDSGPGERSLLLPAPAAIHFRYFGGTRSGDAPGWHDTWRETDGFPAVVAISLTATPGQPPREIFAAPHVTGIGGTGER